MNCEKIKDIIATDYIDAELSETRRNEIKAHLEICEQCRAYEKSLRNISLEPLRDSLDLKPPVYVWSRVVGRIDRERSRSKESVLARLKDYLEPLFNIPKPVFATIAIAIIILSAAGAIVHSNSRSQINGFFQDQQEFLASLDLNGLNSSIPGFGTAIEEYFL